jgi:hypothetical protein
MELTQGTFEIVSRSAEWNLLQRGQLSPSLSD